MSLPLNAIQVLTECGSGLKTGCLSVKHQSMQWKVFFSHGKLLYADCSAMDLSHLQYFFIKRGWMEALDILKKMPQDSDISVASQHSKENGFDQAMAWIWLYQGLEIQQLQQLIKDISLTALETLIWLQDGSLQWHDRDPLPSWIQASMRENAPLDLGQTIQYLHQRLKQWQRTPEMIKSPHQRLYLRNDQDINTTVEHGTLSPAALSQFAKLLHQDLSFRQLSLYLKQDELSVAKLLAPYIEENVIHLRSPKPPYDQLPHILRGKDVQLTTSRPQTSKARKIICIDDSPVMLSELQRFLDDDKYDVTTIDNPIKASATIFKLKPDLILLDITMPKINGYSLCSLLRNSAVFDTTPIIMVSGNTGLIDKARAKICGATGYLTKPFTQQELLGVVDKHLS